MKEELLSPGCTLEVKNMTYLFILDSLTLSDIVMTKQGFLLNVSHNFCTFK